MLKTFYKNYLKLHSKEILLLIFIFFIALFLRLYPGKDHLIWSYDQARDAYRIREIFEQRDLKLVGPQTEFVGLRHGVLSYYLLSPWYFWSAGDPNLPALFMVLFNLSSLIPLFFLSRALFKDKTVTFISLLIFSIAYQQVEYSRWLSNVSIVIPFLSWFYYFLWKIWSKHKTNLFVNFCLGLSLGLSIQGQFFLIFLLPILFLLFWFKKKNVGSFVVTTVGILLATSSMWLAEIKFGFLATKTFFTEFIGGQTTSLWRVDQAILLYLNHLGLVIQQNIFGLTMAMGVFVLIGILWLIKIYWLPSRSKELKFLLFFLFVHSILFTLNPIDAVFLDLTMYVPLIILVAFILARLIRKNLLIGFLFLLLITSSQIFQLIKNTQNQTPFQNYNFIQTGILFSQKMEIVEQIYQLVDGEDFSLSVLGTPYGVQTVWASIFEQYKNRNPKAILPVWYGQRALGYPADTFFEKVDKPLDKHIFIKEDNQELISKYIRQQVLEKQKEETLLVEELELHGYILQIRRSNN